MRREFQAHDIDLGYVYSEGAVIPDGTPAIARDPAGTNYRPTTRPGHRMPHAWLDTADGRISTHDLLGDLLLITGSDGAAWEAAAADVIEETGVPMRFVSIGMFGTFADTDGQWRGVAEISDGGAILVRPDGHVGWRSVDSPDHPSAALRAAVCTLLRRS
jgi:2,4-dichlorophenol 6-monooxygenase